MFTVISVFDASMLALGQCVCLIAGSYGAGERGGASRIMQRINRPVTREAVYSKGAPGVFQFVISFTLAVFLFIGFSINNVFADNMVSLSGQTSEFVFGPGDIMELEVFGAEELTRTARVSSAGFITLPLLGQVKVDGLSERKVEELLEVLLKEKYIKDPQVSVFIKDSGYFYVLGNINRAPGGGRLPYVPGITFMRAIAMAGGITEVGKASRVQITRRTKQGNKIMKVNFNKIRDGKAEDINIMKDDIIYVPESYLMTLARAFFFRYTSGNVSVGATPNTLIPGGP